MLSVGRFVTASVTLCKDFSKALLTVEGVLTREPDFPEALLLKAQLLWEGFEDAVSAKQCLIDMLKVETDKKSPFHRWALALYKEISASQRKHGRSNHKA